MRTRFAPSPTGFLHVGGLRTALYAYILAKQTDGKFLLRIEDTDQERSVNGAIENLIHGLSWAGIAPDEGVMLKHGEIVQEGSVGPYIQSERLSIYRQYADQLRTDDYAYPCFCSPERLERMRHRQQEAKEPPMYDQTCLKLSAEEVSQKLNAGEPHVLRLKIPRDEVISFEDDVRGLVTFRGDTVDDQVLLKSDGFPTYHLAHVVDDHLMEIDLVLRGEEWLSSTPKHILLFQYLGWKPPRYAHVSLLLNKDKSKLSKRQNAVSVSEYIERGYLPEVLVNFLAMLGWNSGTTQELFTMQELIEQFSLDRVQKAGAVFDTEKLDWLQGQWIRRMNLDDFSARVKEAIADDLPAALSDPDFSGKASLIQERLTFFRDAAGMLSFFYKEPAPTVELLANPKQKVTPEILPEIFALLLKVLATIEVCDWNLERLTEELLKAIEAEPQLKRGQVLWVLRAALTGEPFSPGAFEVAAVLGKEKTLGRLGAANCLF